MNPITNNAADADKVVAAWARQLQTQVKPFVRVACLSKGKTQVVLYMDANGRVGSPKITVTGPMALDNGDDARVE